MTELAQELKKLRFGLEGGAADEDFVARVLAACGEARESSATRAPFRRDAWKYGAFAAAAACVALAVSLTRTEPAPPATETIAARGNKPAAGLTAIVQAFVGHAAPGAVPALLEGATLRPGHGILVRYSNPAPEDAYLMVFALDERGSVHWIHPAYLNESTNPTSLKLAAMVTQRVLPEVAEPEDAAPGLLRVYALLSRVALDVKGVESKLAGSQRTIFELFPQAEVEEWRCTWTP